jgi:hypothetical protein
MAEECSGELPGSGPSWPPSSPEEIPVAEEAFGIFPELGADSFTPAFPAARFIFSKKSL